MGTKPIFFEMIPQVVVQLLQLNRDFYGRFAHPFAHSRAQPQPGFNQLLAYLPSPCSTVLDVGCGDGRFGRFLLSHQAIKQYSGVDFSPELLQIAQVHTAGTFYQRDMARQGCLDELGQFDAVACLAVLQHIPGRANRLHLLREIREHLRENGRLLLSNWQFWGSERQRRKVIDWTAVGLTTSDVEPQDYLLTWERGGSGLRYACLIDETETAELAHATGFQRIHHFYSDGKEGNLSLYTILSPQADNHSN